MPVLEKLRLQNVCRWVRPCERELHILNGVKCAWAARGEFVV
jgi:hypothetical protein